MMEEIGDAIADKAMEMKDPVENRVEQLKEAADQLKGKAMEMAADIKQAAGAGIDQARSKVDDIKGQAQQMAAAAVEQASDLAADAREKSIALAASAGQTAEAARSGIAEQIKKHPVAAIVTGAGVGWLLMAARRSRSRDEALQKGSEADYPISYTEPGSVKPLAMGALAVVVGLGLGLVMPESQIERDLIGDARDRFKRRAADRVHDIAEKMKNLTDAATESARANAALEPMD